MQDFLQKKTFFYKNNKFFIEYMTTIYFNCIHLSYKKAAFIPDASIGGSEDNILSTSVHCKGFGMKLSVRASSLHI